MIIKDYGNKIMKIKVKVPFILIFTIQSIIFLNSFSHAQVFKSSIKIEASRLPETEREELQGLSEKIANYIENFSWTDEAFDTVVEFQLQIFVESVTTRGGERIYYAKALVSNNYDQKYYDKGWQFLYNRNDAVIHSNIFHPLTAFIDFYIYLVLAGEIDTYGTLLGTPYYDMARDVASRGKFSPYRKGWNKRIEIVDDILNNRKYRIMKSYFYEGFYLLAENNRREARKKMLEAISLIEQIFSLNNREKYTRLFLEAHHQELADFFKNFNDPEIYERLAQLDPDHEEVYEKYLKYLNR